MPPGEFIAFAEETGAVVEIGAIVLERVVEKAVLSCAYRSTPTSAPPS